MGDRYINPRVQLFSEVLIVTVPIATALALSNLSRRDTAIGFILAILAVGIVKYFLIYSPRISFKEQKVTSFLDHHLEMIINDYQHRYDTDYDVRANVMLPQSQRRLSYGNNGLEYTRHKYLQIAYCAGGGSDKDIQRHDAGDRDETETAWSINKPVEGNCGRAFAAKKVRVAGRQSSVNSWSGHETTIDQDEVTKSVNSIMSIPIRKPSGDTPVAILNIDASVRIEDTNFRDDEVQEELAERYAEPIGILL